MARSPITHEVLRKEMRRSAGDNKRAEQKEDSAKGDVPAATRKKDQHDGDREVGQPDK